MSEGLKLIGIKSNAGIYITAENSINVNYYQSTLEYYLYNGNPPVFTFHKDWIFVEKELISVSKKYPRQATNFRYELTDKSFQSDKIPLVLSIGDIEGEYDWEAEEQIYDKKYSSIRSLYNKVNDWEEEKLIEVPFELKILLEIDEIKTPQNWSYNTKVGNVANDHVNYQMFDKIFFPSLIIHERPCKLTSRQTYEIVREFVKRNINPQFARVTSDYDFCFTVKKIVPLAKPYSFQTETTNSTKRRPKFKTIDVKSTEIEIFNMTSSEDKYNGYTIIEGFEGKNQDDLKENIDNYLKELIEKINEPLKQCECCNGVGYILNNLQK